MKLFVVPAGKALVIGVLALGALGATAAPAAAHRHVCFNCPVVVAPHVPPNVVYVPRHYYYPSPVYPSWAVPPTSAWAPGYWTYQWVPQVSYNWVWVLPRWSVDGRFIEGHWVQRPTYGGHYNRVWIGGRWR
ncbi:MAG TPA: hypothetical protein VFN71_08980 [Methylomirabilota bacterium]|nr:hypothetical protein [Methylomirabilota bacterium]